MAQPQSILRSTMPVEFPRVDLGGDTLPRSGTTDGERSPQSDLQNIWALYFLNARTDVDKIFYRTVRQTG